MKEKEKNKTMIKKIKRQVKGITLIALVVTIILLLILAAVAINLTLGDNGIITRAMQAAFITEMAQVEESVQMWKANSFTEVPTNKICEQETIENSKRLGGEIGYYRKWASTDTKPEQGLFIGDDEQFNQTYKGDLTYYPQGVYDLYELNNKELGINNKNKYLIDVSNGMVYKVDGFKSGKTMVYSKNMLLQVLGNGEKPNFIQSEATEEGRDGIYAGNTDPDNPYGFQIIAHPQDTQGTNLYKLYNNGDLYGRGVKGSDLNTSTEEMEKINAYVWNDLSLPENLKNYKRIYPAESENVYLIDSEDNLWAIGANSYNQFGLTKEQQIEYTGREWIKLNVNGKKVKDVYTQFNNVFVITTDNNLYACGINTIGQLGIGNKEEISTFTKVNFPYVSQIKDIKNSIESDPTIIQLNNNTFYFAGRDKRNAIGVGNTEMYFYEFTRIWDGNIGPDIDQDIVDWTNGNWIVIVKKDGSMWISGFTGYIGKNLTTEKDKNFTKYNIDNVKSVYAVNYRCLVFSKEDEFKNLEYWAIAGESNDLGNNYNGKFTKFDIPEELKINGIKEVLTMQYGVIFLSNNGELYGTGSVNFLGKNDSSSNRTDNVEKLNINNVKTLNPQNIETHKGNIRIPFIQDNNLNIKITGSSSIIAQNTSIQENWTKVASNVLYFNASGGCYVDRDNNLWVAGDDSNALGLGTQYTESTKIPNYIMCTDPNIKGKVVEAKIDKHDNVIGVKLKDGSLWTSGYYSKNGSKGYPGWKGTDNKNTFTKILDNVTNWDIYRQLRTAVSDGKLYGWGTNYGGSTGINKASTTPLEITELPREMQDVSQIAKLNVNSWITTHAITKNGKIFVTGNWNNGIYWGGHTMTPYYSEYTHNLNLESGDSIKDMVAISANTAIILTTKGNVYGFGQKAYLGINSNSLELTETIKLPIDNVKEITAGRNFFIATKNDGSVWGTGDNSNGVFGRWKGSDRYTPNSRYRTAYEWVEFPELEI